MQRIGLLPFLYLEGVQVRPRPTRHQLTKHLRSDYLEDLTSEMARLLSTRGLVLWRLRKIVRELWKWKFPTSTKDQDEQGS